MTSGRTLEALIFDLDGTLAETEELHRQAFNTTFAAAGFSDRWDVARYRDLLSTTGGRQRMSRHFAETGRDVDEASLRSLHALKNAHYAALVAAGITLRPGVATLCAAAREKGIALAIATTTSRANLDAFLARAGLGPFDVLVAGEDVDALKPDPAAYVLALSRLAVPADAALAFEDSVNGLKAARGAGLRCVVTPGLYTTGDDFGGATQVRRDLDGFALDDW